MYLILSALARDHFINEAMKISQNTVCNKRRVEGNRKRGDRREEKRMERGEEGEEGLICIQMVLMPADVAFVVGSGLFVFGILLNLW